ncbi:hypothetical protein VTN00DRAFT_6286 [Thermoascus crustaceus]|uniref:uncharacterized protein n=1 Tax=Thermoascus crustaceus TaxID=5088 RepID=UPI003742D381
MCTAVAASEQEDCEFDLVSLLFEPLRLCVCHFLCLVPRSTLSVTPQGRRFIGIEASSNHGAEGGSYPVSIHVKRMAQVGIYHESTGFVYIHIALGEKIGEQEKWKQYPMEGIQMNRQALYRQTLKIKR